MQGAIVILYDDDTKRVEPVATGLFKGNPSLIYEIVHQFLDQVIVTPALKKGDGSGEKSAGTA